MYKLIAVDMDGTLLREDRSISKETVKAIKYAREKGVRVILASGRPIDGIRPYLEKLDLIESGEYVLSYNGAIVQNIVTGEIVAGYTMKGKDYKRIYEESKRLSVNIHAFTKEGCITPKLTRYTELEGEINKIPVKVVPMKDIGDEDTVIKVMMVDDEKELDRAIKVLPKELYDKYTIVRSAPFFLEFLHKRSNKGEGIKVLTELLGIKPEEVICIGDAGNDFHMIEYAGLGVAMGNGSEEIKAVADYITKSNEENGVAHVINKFIQ